MEMYKNEFYHHGIKGQKWGVRRFQNPDGTLTEAGKKRQARLDKKKADKESYKRGKEAYNRRRILTEEKMNKYRENSIGYTSARDQATLLKDRYDINDNGRTSHDDFNSKYAEMRYQNLKGRMDMFDSMYIDKAKTYAENKIKKEYGDEIINDIAHYETVSQGRVFAAMSIGALGLLTVAALANKDAGKKMH